MFEKAVRLSKGSANMVDETEIRSITRSVSAAGYDREMDLSREKA